MNTIPEITRRSIIGCFSREVPWSGTLGDADFLNRLYDLKKMPSKDTRLENAYRDIWQHRTYKDDWVDDWVFTDERFNLLTVPDDIFLRFLTETVHHQVRPEEKATEELVAKFNEFLKADGWELFRKDDPDGHVFQAKTIGSIIDVSGKSAAWQKVDRFIQEMRFILRTAVAEGDYHNVALISIDALEAIAQAAHDQPDSAESLIEADAETSVKLLIEGELKGEANKDALTLARAALKLSLSLKEANNFDRRSAALGVEALASLANIVSILCDKQANL